MTQPQPIKQMSWTLIICQCAELQHRNGKFPGPRCTEQKCTVCPEGGYCFSVPFKNEYYRLKRVDQTNFCKPQSRQKRSHESQRVSFGEEKAKEVGERSILAWRRKGKNGQRGRFHILLTSCCLSAWKFWLESMRWCVYTEVCVLNREREREREVKEPLAYCERTIRNGLYSSLISANVNGGKNNSVAFSPSSICCSVSAGLFRGG